MQTTKKLKNYTAGIKEIKKDPLVSIIVITYNSSKYVLETLDSIKSQTYQNIELIISDDSSTDETVKICKDWIQENKTRFVNTELITSERNTGISANSNRGSKAAKGTWLKLIAGDDQLLENCVQDNIHFIQKTRNANFVTSKVKHISTSGEPINNQPKKYDGLRTCYFAQSAQKQLKTYARLPVFLNSPSFFIKKEAMENADFFDESVKIYDDICLIYRMHENNVKIHFLNKFTVKYRIHENGISRKKDIAVEGRRENEQIFIFNKYRKKNLNRWNLIDLSVYYETWLNYKYKGFKGYKMKSILQKFSLFYWYLKYLKIRRI